VGPFSPTSSSPEEKTFTYWWKMASARSKSPESINARSTKRNTFLVGTATALPSE
jgi:hypothetical protein